MTTTYYYTNAFDSTYLEWTESGASPYLSTINYPTDYIALTVAGLNKREGIWDFPNSGAESAEIIDNVVFEAYCNMTEDPDIGFSSLTFYVWTGAAWSAVQAIAGGDGWAWRTHDITDLINTWAKVDSARIYVRASVIGVVQTNFVDCIRLKVVSHAAAAGGLLLRKQVGVGL